MHKLAYTEEAKKQIDKFDNRLKRKVRMAVEEIARDPFTGKPLSRELRGLFSYRVEDYRIVYRVYRAEITVLIFMVGHRKEIYKKISQKNW